MCPISSLHTPPCRLAFFLSPSASPSVHDLSHPSRRSCSCYEGGAPLCCMGRPFDDERDEVVASKGAAMQAGRRQQQPVMLQTTLIAAVDIVAGEREVAGFSLCTLQSMVGRRAAQQRPNHHAAARCSRLTPGVVAEGDAAIVAGDAGGGRAACRRRSVKDVAMESGARRFLM
ncbi:hypothetical protein VPH35_051073 [Triticum aestivum]